MCFNAEVSLTTFLIGLVGSYQLYLAGYIPEAIFYAWVSHMQLFEFLLWKLQPCNSTNIAVSKVGIIWNHLEPFVLWLAIIYFSKVQLPMHIHVAMVLFGAWTLIYTQDVFVDECTTVTKESSPHLHWKWNYGPYGNAYYTVFLISLIVLSYFGLQAGHVNALLVLISFLVSKQIYGKTHSTGALWCFFAVFCPVVYPYLMQANQ